MAADASDDSTPRATLGAYLGEQSPFWAMWRHLIAIAFRDGPRDENLSYLSEPARNLYLSGVLQGEIGGGGLSTFFSNSSGNHVPETFEALRAMEAIAIEKLLERALVPFDGAFPPRDREARCAQLFAFEERGDPSLSALDDEFAHLEPDLEDLRQRYVVRHAASPLLANDARSRG